MRDASVPERVLSYDLFVVTKRSPDDDSLRLELQEALVTFRNWVTQIAQTIGIAATVDAVLVTYGFSQRLAAILFLASAFPVGALLLYLRIMSVAAPLISIAIRIERKLSIEESLAATYAKAHLPLPSRIASIDSLSDEELLNLDQEFSERHWLRKQIPLLLYAATAIQIGIAVLSLTVYHYRFM
jgi:hypothetical protein